jgi:hypothetical protein
MWPCPRYEGRLIANKGPRGAFRGMKGPVPAAFLLLPIPGDVPCDLCGPPSGVFGFLPNAGTVASQPAS